MAVQIEAMNTSNGFEIIKSTFGGHLLKKPFHLSGEMEDMYNQNTDKEHVKFYAKLTFEDEGEASITSLLEEANIGLMILKRILETIMMPPTVV